MCFCVWGTAVMSNFSGVATMNDDRVPVTVGLDEEKISLVAGDRSLGEWSANECEVTEVESGTFVITAADDTISFRPDDPGSFARGLGLWSRPGELGGGPGGEATAPVHPVEAPPPGQATRIGFYALTVLTVALMIWAVISLLD